MGVVAVEGAELHLRRKAGLMGGKGREIKPGRDMCFGARPLQGMGTRTEVHAPVLSPKLQAVPFRIVR